jgi:hypothetical protein
MTRSAPSDHKTQHRVRCGKRLQRVRVLDDPATHDHEHPELNGENEKRAPDKAPCYAQVRV